MIRRLLPALLFVAAAGFCVSVASRAQEEAAPEPVLFGQSAALSGPAGSLGRAMQTGIQAAFEEANSRGGIFGRPLKLMSLDDAYEPEAAIANTRQLVANPELFGLIGGVGTSTSRSTAPVAAAAGIPYVAPLTGDASLREETQANVIHLRPSYAQETARIVERLITDLGMTRFGVFYQDDSFGRAGFDGVRAALREHGLQPVAVGVYPRNSTAVKSALLDLLAGDPGAVILVGAYQPVARLIAWARHIGFDPVFATLSFVGGNALLTELRDVGAGVFVTQVVPFPLADEPPVAVAYREALAAHAPQAAPGFISFEGYLAGRLAIFALERCGRAPDRTCFVNSLRDLKTVDLDGFVLHYDDGDSQGSDLVYFTAIGDDGRYHAIQTLNDRERS